jgi:acylphosphatase
MDFKDEMKTLHAVIEGHVQGVGFRYFVKETAERLQLTGWVRNRYDGTVELSVEGGSTHLQALLDAVHVGPSRSIVTDVRFEWGTDLHEYTQFSFLPTE